MPRMYMAIAQEDRHPIVEIMQQTPDIPDNCQWAIFLRNHDELTLEMVTEPRARLHVPACTRPTAQARINLGIRRRLAPLMENDRDRIELMNSLLLSMPGTPIIYYGDEIGMGDNIYLGDRNGVRTPMQWSPDRNAGFSRADPQRLYLPPIMDPMYGYEAVNVEAQAREPALAAATGCGACSRCARRSQALRPRHARASSSPATARSSPTCASTATRRSCASPTCRALGAAGRARPRALQGPRAGRDAGPHAVPADRRAALPADAAGARLLLVPPGRRRARRRAGTRSGVAARGPARCWCCSTAGPASSATAWCRGASAWPSALRAQFETEVLPPLHRGAALVCGQGRDDRGARARRPGRVGRRAR